MAKKKQEPDTIMKPVLIEEVVGGSTASEFVLEEADVPDHLHSLSWEYNEILQWMIAHPKIGIENMDDFFNYAFRMMLKQDKKVAFYYHQFTAAKRAGL